MVDSAHVIHHSLWKKIVIIIVGVVGAALLAGVIWFSITPPAGDTAQAGLTSDDTVTVSTEKWLTFSPKNKTPDTGFIFYPGARVRPEAYTDTMHDIAAQGYLVIVPNMPLNFALLGIDTADSVRQDHPGVLHWFVGGHSVGGTAAAMYADKHRQTTAGLVLWGSYPANSTNLHDFSGIVMSISASNDGLSTPSRINDTKYLLPDATKYVVIEGGNHAGFGDYGAQAGDQPATISLASQHEQIVAATLTALSSTK